MFIIITVFKIFCFLETFLRELRLKTAYHYHYCCVQKFLFLETFLNELRLMNAYYFYCSAFF